MTSNERDTKADWPAVDELFSVSIVDGVHPSCLAIDQLLSECSLRTQRRSGPGGQHRNKTSSGVFLEHHPTGQIAEATERRSQADNRGIAMERLRLKLAVVVRSPLAIADTDHPVLHQNLMSKYRGGNLKIAIRNAEFASVLALLMNNLWRAGGQPSLVAPLWGVSTSAINRLLRLHAAALTMTNMYRSHHGRLPLR